MPTSRPRPGQARIKPSIDEIAETRDRDRKAVELAIAGATLDQIAAQLGYADRSGPFRAIHRSLDRHEAVAVRDLRDLENARIDRLQTVLWPKAMNGDLKAIDRLLRLFERRARLNGLDAPTKAEVRITDDLTAEIEQLAAELAGAGDAGPDRSPADRSPQGAEGPAAG